MDTDCCADDTNHQDVNITHYTISNPYHSHCLAGMSNYCNPVYTNAEITKFLAKADNDFRLDPSNTSFLVVLPCWPSAPWWHYTKVYTQVHQYPKGSRIFTCPAADTYNTDELTPAGDEGGPGRVFIQGTPWPVVLLHRDQYTPPQVDGNMLLHLRFGHLGAKHLVSLLDSGIDTGVNADRSQLQQRDPLCSCASCKLAKANRPGPHHARDPADAIDAACLRMSADILGPVEPVAYDGTRYLLGFTVLNNAYTQLYSLKTKDESLTMLYRFIKWLRLHPFKDKFTTRRLHLDNDAVFTSKDFDHVCTENDILTTFAAPYVAQTNSRIEVVWRDHTRMALAFLLQSGIDYKYWPLAYHHSCYIRNRTPQRQLGYNTPFAIAFGHLPDLSRVRIFGCTAFSWVHPGGRKKLDNKSIETVYVGHEEDSPQQYLLLDKSTGKVIHSAKPQFVECLDEQSRRLLSVDLRGLVPTLIAEFGGSQPAPWADGSISSRDIRILDLSAYYDSEDHETVGAVQFISHSHPRGAWTSARSYIGVSPSSYAHLVDFVKHSERLGRLERLRPVFSLVTARLGRAYEPGLVVAVDVTRTDFPDTAYTVATDPAATSGELIDVQVKFVRFGSVSKGGIPSAIAATVSSISTSSAPTPSSSPTTHEAATPTSAADLDTVPYYADYLNYSEPLTYKQAKLLPDFAHWDASVNRELDSLITKGVMQFVDTTALPPGTKTLSTKWVFKLKKDAEGKLDKYKSRLVAKGFLQREGIDYDETFAPASQLNSFRILLTIAANLDLQLSHLDVKTAFLNSDLAENLYIRLPEDATDDKGNSTAKLVKSIYGLKQAAHDWHKTSEKFILNFDNRIKKSSVEPCMYFLVTHNLQVVFLVHVDDYIVASNSRDFTRRFTDKFNSAYGVNDLGKLSHFMQMSVSYENDKMTLSQQRFIEELASKYHMENCKAKDTPMEQHLNLPKQDTFDSNLPFRSLLGSLLWLARGTRPDISFAVSYMSQFANCYGEQHFAALRRVLKYLISTKGKKLEISVIKSKQFVLDVYTDSDWAHDNLDRKSVTGTCIMLNNVPITWTSRKQSIVATSSCEAEYIAASESIKDMLYSYHMLNEIFTVQLPVTMFIDNTGALQLAEKTLNNQRSKHIDVRYHHIRHWVQSKVVKLEKVRSIDNTADIFTKALPTRLHLHHSATFLS